MIIFDSNITILFKYYGTYLAVLVRDLLQDATQPLSVKQIALQLHQYEDDRQQKNFEVRIRTALGHLLHEQLVESQTCKGPRNLYYLTYSIIQHEKDASGATQSP